MPKLVQVEAIPAAAPVDESFKPEWRERTLVFRLESGRVVALDAWQHGTLCFHATWGVEGKHGIVGVEGVKPFTITHAPSLLSVARTQDCEEAAKRIEWLWQSCPRAWAADPVDVAAIPPDVVRWCKENMT